MLRVRNEQLGDAEVQQFRLAGGVHQHIGGLEVPMQDQSLVRRVHGRTHQAEQRQSLGDIQRPRITEGIDGFAGDKFEHQVGSALFGRAGVEQTRDVRVIERGENAALAVEAAAQFSRGEFRADQLDGHRLHERTVVTFTTVDRTHSAAAQFVLDAPGSDALGRGFRGR